VRTRRRSVVFGLSVIWTALLLGTPGAALGATSTDIDLVAAQLGQTVVDATVVGHDATVQVGVYFHGTGQTAINEVTAHIVAPGGTRLNPDYLAANCTGVTDREATCPWPGELWPGQGEGTPFYGWNVRLTLLSLQVTPGTFSVSCGCDINPANNSTSFTLTVRGLATPTPPAAPAPTTAPRASQTTRPARPTVVVGASATPVAAAPASTTTSAETSPSPSEASASDPVPSKTVAEVPMAARSSHGASTPLIVTVTLAGAFVAGLGMVAWLRRQARMRASRDADS
jgi:hypothetical protein